MSAWMSGRPVESSKQVSMNVFGQVGASSSRRRKSSVRFTRAHSASAFGEGGFENVTGHLHQEFLDPTSGLHRFRPDFILIVTTWRDLRQHPELTDSREDVKRRVDAEIATWTSLWHVAREKLGCQIIQSNFAAPPWRAMGNLESRHPAGFGRFISLVNHALQVLRSKSPRIHGQ